MGLAGLLTVETPGGKVTLSGEKQQPKLLQLLLKNEKTSNSKCWGNNNKTPKSDTFSEAKTKNMLPVDIILQEMSRLVLQ